MKNFLQKVVNLKKKEVEALKTKRPITHFVDSKRLLKGKRSFSEAISSGDSVNLIAEIKKRSPSHKKDFVSRLDVAGLAELYAKNGASAISVLTDKRFFGGDISYIGEARKAVSLPVLRKDFIIDEYQVYESRYFGADAILLIARILDKEKLKGFLHLSRRIGMACLVEIHDEKDLENALLAGARIIGINNRDLNTFETDLAASFNLVTKMPDQIIKVSESGIKSREDVLRLESLGVDAVLIGGAFLSAGDIGGKIKEMMGEERADD